MSYSVLFVEDSQSVREVIRRAFQAIDGPVRTFYEAETLAEAILLLDRHPIDVVLLDLSLPDAHGLDGLVRFRRHAPVDLPVVILTGQDDRELAVRALKAGAHDYLVKGSVDPTALEQHLCHAIERARAERQLAEGQKMEAVGRLTSGIAHDYNNLLMGLMGCLDIAIDLSGPEARALLQEARTAAQRGAEMTRQLLTFADPRDSPAQDVDLDELIGSSEKMIRFLLNDSIRFGVHLDGGGWRTYAEAGQLQQVLMNLVINARDAMPDGGELQVRAERCERDEREWLVLRVVDEGTGMTDEVRERIFEPFFTTKTSGQGTGLGLSSVYGIVRRAGGFIEVQSVPGHGSTFSVFFPRHEVTGEYRPVPKPAAPAAAARESRTVLVIEDNPLVRTAVRSYLEKAGYRTLEACDADQAWLVMRSEGPSIGLIVADVMLPGMRGPQIVAELGPSSPPAIFMSAHPASSLESDGLVPRGAVTLQKPFTREELLGTVQRVLDAFPMTLAPPLETLLN